MTTQRGATVEPTAPTPDEPPKGQVSQQESTRAQLWFRYTLPGAWVALLFVCLSFTPTLLPRPAFFQGFVCGINGAIGYALGVLGAWLWREFANRPARVDGWASVIQPAGWTTDKADMLRAIIMAEPES
jgi:uncharacterized membrane protein